MWKGFVSFCFFPSEWSFVTFLQTLQSLWLDVWFMLTHELRREMFCQITVFFTSLRSLCQFLLSLSFFLCSTLFFIHTLTRAHMYFLAQMKVRRHISLTWNAFFFELKVLESHKDINHTRPLLWNELEVSHVCTLHLRAQGALWNNQLHGWGKASSILPSLKILNFSCSSIFFSSNVSLLSSLSPASSLLPIILLALPLSSSFLSFLSLLLLLGSEPQRCRACR